MTVANGTYETYKLYWYALVPDYALDSPAPEDEKWFGMGIGEISAVKAPEDYKVKGNWGIYKQYYGTISVSDYKPIDMPSVGSNVTPGLCPDITWKGKTYKYAQKGSENSLKQGYYTLEPARLAQMPERISTTPLRRRQLSTTIMSLFSTRKISTP